MKFYVRNVDLELGWRACPTATAEIEVLFNDLDHPVSPRQIAEKIQQRLNSDPKPLTVKKCIFNGPATIIIWSDNTKTIVKCKKDATYDREKAFMAAYMKKLFGNGNGFKKEIKKWVEKKDD